RQLVIAEGEDVVGDLGLATSPDALDAAGADRLAADAAVGDYAPSRRPQRRVDKFGAGLRLVHSAAAWMTCDGDEVSSPKKALCKIECFSSDKCVSLCE